MLSTTFSYFLLDAFSLACAIQIDELSTQAALRQAGITAASWQTGYKSPQQLDCRENWIYTYRIHQNDHPSSNRFMNITSTEC